MRFLVLLLLGVGVVWLVLEYYPASESEGAETGATPGAVADGPSPAGDGRFLSAPPASGGAASRAAGPDAGLAEGTGAASLGTSRAGADSATLAAALLHGTPRELDEFLAGYDRELPDERVRFLRAFSHGIAGSYERARSLAAGLEPGRDVSAREHALLKEAVGGGADGVRAMPAAASDLSPLLLAMEIALRATEGYRLAEARQWSRAASAFTDVLLAEVDAPWPSDAECVASWADALNAAQAEHRWNLAGDWPSLTVKVEPGDSLSLIRARVVEENPGLRMCTGLIERLNRAEGRYLQQGEVLRIPTDPVRVLVDLESRWLFYMMGEEVAAAWPVAIGAPGSETRTGEYVVGELLEDPTWFRPGQPHVPFGDPENPLGTRWIGWNHLDGRASSLGFHGTWEPETIGQAVSDGCIRMRNDDVEVLFQILPRESPIRVQG